MRLSPLDPLGFRAQGGIALAHFLAGPLRRVGEVGGDAMAGRAAEAHKAIDGCAG